MEYTESLGKMSDELTISNEAKNHLFETAKWAKFLAIVSMVMYGLAILIMIVLFFVLNNLPADSLMAQEGIPAWIFLIYIVFILIFLYPILKIYRFATLGKKALLQTDAALLTSALENQLAAYKFYGILIIIALIFYAISIVVAGIAFTSML